MAIHSNKYGGADIRPPYLSPQPAQGGGVIIKPQDDDNSSGSPGMGGASNLLGSCWRWDTGPHLTLAPLSLAVTDEGPSGVPKVT